MIKIKSFQLSECEQANKFMEDHAPRSNEKSNGLIFHEGSIVIIYDDNKPSKDANVNRIANLLQERRDALINNNIVLRLNEEGLKKFAPNGFEFTWTDKQIRDAIQKANPILKYKEINMIMDRLAVYGNQVLKSKFTIEEIVHDIETYEKMLSEELKKAKK